MGRKRSFSLASLCLRKYCVAASFGPLRMARVFQAHLLDGVLEQAGGLGHGAFGGVVHGGDELVGVLVLPEGAQQLFHLLQFLGQRDLHVRVVEEAAVLAQFGDGLLGTLGEGLLQAADHLVVGQGAGDRVGAGFALGVLGLLEQLVHPVGLRGGGAG